MIFGIAAYDFLGRASFSRSDTRAAVMSLYVDKSYASLVNDLFTGAGYEVEMREHGLVFLKKGKNGHYIHKVTPHAGHPDSFDSVDKPRNLPVGTCGAGYVSGLGANERLMQTIAFLHRVQLMDGVYSLFPARYDDDDDDEHGGQSRTPVTVTEGPLPTTSLTGR
jgi:hypothetical protein